MSSALTEIWNVRVIPVSTDWLFSPPHCLDAPSTVPTGTGGVVFCLYLQTTVQHVTCCVRIITVVFTTVFQGVLKTNDWWSIEKMHSPPAVTYGFQQSRPKNWPKKGILFKVSAAEL